MCDCIVTSIVKYGNAMKRYKYDLNLTIGAEILIFAKMKLFLFFIGSSFATTCFKCRATTMEESQVSTTPPSSLPSLISGRVSFVLLFHIEGQNIISEAVQNRLRIYEKPISKNKLLWIDER